MTSLAVTIGVPVERRAAAARRVILDTPSLDERGRKAILATAIWPTGGFDPTYPRRPLPEPGIVTVERTCADCGRPFSCPRRRQRYCSRSCASRAAHRARQAAR